MWSDRPGGNMTAVVVALLSVCFDLSVFWSSVAVLLKVGCCLLLSLFCQSPEGVHHQVLAALGCGVSLFNVFCTVWMASFSSFLVAVSWLLK